MTQSRHFIIEVTDLESGDIVTIPSVDCLDIEEQSLLDHIRKELEKWGWYFYEHYQLTKVTVH